MTKKSSKRDLKFKNAQSLRQKAGSGSQHAEALDLLSDELREQLEK